jgi:hypothetical protein
MEHLHIVGARRECDERFFFNDTCAGLQVLGCVQSLLLFSELLVI